MHPIRDAFSRHRWLLLCSACALAFAAGAEARPLVPEKPSVEVNLNALRELTPATYLPAPPAPAALPYEATPLQRQVPAQQYGTPTPAAKPVAKPAVKPAPKRVAKPASAPTPQPVLPPPPAPKVEAPAPIVPSPVAPAPVVPVAPAPALPVAPVPSLPSIPAAPVPPIDLPVVAPPKIDAPKPVPIPVPAPKVETPKPAPKVEPPKPALKVETPKPAPKVETPKAVPAQPAVAPVTDLPPLPTMEAPKVELPKPAPKADVPPALPSIPKSATKPASDINLPPLPSGVVNVPSVNNIRANTPPEPDISGLNFSKLPGAKPAATPAPAPAAKKADDALPPLAPVAPSEPALPAPPKADTGPLLIPVPKPPAPLPPSVTQRLDALNPAPPEKTGIVSDKTVVRDVPAEKKAKAEAEAKIKADQAAAAAALKKQQMDAELALKKAQAESDAKAKAEADAKLKAETEMAAAKKAAEDKAKAETAAAKKAAVVMPPASLPPPLPSIPAMPDPLAKSAAPVKLDDTKIGSLPALNSKPAPAAPAAVPELPKAPSIAPSNPNLPKLPTLVIPGAQPDKPLPSLTAITGDANPTTADIMQPKDSVDSVALPPVGTSPIPPALPELDDSLPTVKRELPEIDIGAPVAKAPALPTVTRETKAPGLPSIPAAPTVTPKTETPVVVASAPTVSTSGNLETSIAFSANSSALTDAEKTTLAGIADKARKGQKKVRIVGYAAGDADKAAVARKTAFARANIIRAFLLSKGMSDSMIHAQALGNQVSQDKADIFLQ